MHLTIAYSKIKKRNLVLINNVTHQRETISEWPIRQPLICSSQRSEKKGCSVSNERRVELVILQSILFQ